MGRDGDDCFFGWCACCCWEEEGEEDKGSMYRYIWVEKRFGRLVGEIQRVKGTRFSVNGLVAMLFVGYQ